MTAIEMIKTQLNEASEHAAKLTGRHNDSIAAERRARDLLMQARLHVEGFKIALSALEEVEGNDKQ